MSSKESNIANKVLDNIKAIKGYDTDKELAEALDKRPNVISTWRSRNSPDWMLLFKKFDYISKSEMFGEDNQEGLNASREVSRGYSRSTPNPDPDTEVETVDLIRRIRNGPWSEQAKLQMIDEILKISEHESNNSNEANPNTNKCQQKQ